MKLYTEEQVKKVIHYAKHYANGYGSDKDIISSLTPIELPSDEEIDAEAVKYNSKGDMIIIRDIVFIEGAKWMREQIQGGNK